MCIQRLMFIRSLKQNPKHIQSPNTKSNPQRSQLMIVSRIHLLRAIGQHDVVVGVGAFSKRLPFVPAVCFTFGHFKFEFNNSIDIFVIHIKCLVFSFSSLFFEAAIRNFHWLLKDFFWIVQNQGNFVKKATDFFSPFGLNCFCSNMSVKCLSNSLLIWMQCAWNLYLFYGILLIVLCICLSVRCCVSHLNLLIRLLFFFNKINKCRSNENSR